MNIGLDIDDTITNTAELLQKYISEYFGYSLEYMKENHIDYNLLTHTKPEEMKVFGVKTYERVLKQVTVKEHARETIDYFRSQGHKIILITAREKPEYSNAEQFTKEEMELLHINYDKLVCTRDKRGTCIENNVDVFIDDLITNVATTDGAVEHQLVMTTDYNARQECPYLRVNNWDEIKTLIDMYNNESKLLK